MTFAPESQRRPRSASEHVHGLNLELLSSCFYWFERGQRHGCLSLTGAQAAQTVRRAPTLRKRMSREIRSKLPTPTLTTEWKWTQVGDGAQLF